MKKKIAPEKQVETPKPLAVGDVVHVSVSERPAKIVKIEERPLEYKIHNIYFGKFEPTIREYHVEIRLPEPKSEIFKTATVICSECEITRATA